MAAAKIQDRTCPLCEKAYPFPAGAEECEKIGLPRKIPIWKPEERLRLNPEVYARRFPNWPPDQNQFAVAGSLFDGLCKRTVHCVVKLDSMAKRHYYEVCVRWLGGAGDIKTERRVWVRADDLEAGEGKA